MSSSLVSSLASPQVPTLADLLAHPESFELRLLTAEQIRDSFGCDGRCSSKNPPTFQGVWGPLCASCALAMAEEDFVMTVEPSFAELGL